MSEPHKCPACARVFAWAADDDSAIVDAAGPQWRSCRENAYWKLSFHMKNDHPEALTDCPRRSEGVELSPRGDYWSMRDGHRACSYCGSMHPDGFFAAIDAGCEIGPTDKSYKAYVDLPNPDAGKIVEIGSESGPAFRSDGTPAKPDLTPEEIEAGRYRCPHFGPASATVHAKFYFQHLSVEQQERFIALLNAKKVKIGAPGYFYARPFFIAPPKAAAAG